ncbi:DEKNAAC102883 [Brettanomyces naardenensis]|uniref:Structural maintenance of chromosomes protein n=1 Tax=Brettanomyces naardenensis TaxID=13370 RepID=A0A448YLX4_BRENA|nr:DEKNAAC102883 [Brettanomyces naardenensis]
MPTVTNGESLTPNGDVSLEKDADGDSVMADQPEEDAIEPEVAVVGLEPAVVADGGDQQGEADKDVIVNVDSNDKGDTEVHENQQEVLPKVPVLVPRLVIERLVLTNFKSYAGKQVVGPFHPSFSAVVGPNGSGKSNVIDSLLFVFGFRASKMRQSKLSELIHNSEEFPDLSFCRVDIYFKKVVDKFDENGKEYAEDVPDSQLVVSRKAMRNNSSTYYVNDHGSNFTEVRNLLKDQGIDLDHKRFLILQGEVESIAQMKPKAEKDSDDGLLEYLEDIIGTSKYKEPIGECLAKIDDLNDVCVEKERRFEFVEKSKNDLEEPKEKALTYLRKERSYLEKRAIYIQSSLQTDKELLQENEDRLEQATQVLNAALKDGSKIDAENAALVQKNKLLTAEIADIDARVSSLKAKHKKIEREKVTMDEKIKHMQSTQKKVTKTLNSQTLSLKEARSTLSINQENIEKYNGEEQELQAQLVTEKQELEKIKLELADKTKDLSQQMGALQKELQPWKTDIDSKQGELDIKISEVGMLKKRLVESEEEEKRLEKSLEERAALIESKRKQINLLQREKEHVASQIKLGEPEVDDVSKKLRDMERQLMASRQKAEDAKSRVSRTESRNRVLNALVHLKETGRLEGFYGRLGDLGVIDDQYDVAVSTGGGSLDDMVVDTVECAQQCISYIRKNGLGFGKFIVLDKLRRFNLGRISTPGNVPRLFDLIEPAEPKLAPAFYSSMYDTLVAQNLDAANRAAFGGGRRWRVVTLDGKLVDSSGTMSGGGRSVYRGAMKLRSKHSSAGHEISEQDLRLLVADVQNKEKAFGEATSAFSQMEQALNEYKERLPQIDFESSKLEVEIRSLGEEAKGAENRLKELARDNTQKNKIRGEIDALGVKISSLKQEKADLEQQCSGLQGQISELEQRIMDIGGVRMKLQKAKVDSAEQKLEIIGEKKSSCSVAVSKAKNQITRLEKQIASGEKEIEDCEKAIALIQTDYTSRMSTFEESEASIHKEEAAKDEKADEKEKIEDKMEELSSKVSELRSREKDAERAAERAQAAVDEMKQRIAEASRMSGSFTFRDTSELLAWMDPEEQEALAQTMESLPKLSPEALKEVNLESIEQEVSTMKKSLANEEVDLDVLKDYSKRFSEYSERKEDLNTSVTSRDEAKALGEQLKKQRFDEFMAGFEQISSTLREMYHMITMGGNAELELVDSLDPFSEGILFSVMPPRKSWKNISNLSGGEKTLSSLALVFALHSYKPTPLYVMDEIDAALDFRNVSIVANYIKGRTKNAQFIVISLRNNMFELAERLVGIYKVNNMTRSITLENRDMVHGQKREKREIKKGLREETNEVPVSLNS